MRLHQAQQPRNGAQLYRQVLAGLFTADEARSYEVESTTHLLAKHASKALLQLIVPDEGSC